MRVKVIGDVFPQKYKVLKDLEKNWANFAIC